MTGIEAIAALLTLINVALVARRSIWNYPFALVAVTLSGWVFFGQRLYSDTLLQGFFIAINLYGWWNWVRVRAQTGEVQVERLGSRAQIVWAVACVVAIALWGTFMQRNTDAALPYWDASILILSIAAQTLQSRRNEESWWLWILVNLLSIPLYAARGLWIFAALYVVLLSLCFWGLNDWAKARKEARA
ncbi:MAG: nicotinamide riboside transporter PnuC [Sphingomonadales bacterium]|nr:MAG: nicotinamide riboside transporter PnuC [Sphingomonadales bacterium]